MQQTENLLLQPLTPIKQVIDLFELRIAGPEIVQAILAQTPPSIVNKKEPENTY